MVLALVLLDPPFLQAFDAVGGQQLSTWAAEDSRAALAVTALGSARVSVAVCAVVVLCLLVTRRARLAVWIILVVAVSPLLNSFVKLLVDRERPPGTDPLAQAGGSSFPSGHAQAATVLWVAVLLVVGFLVIGGPRGRAVLVGLATVVIGAVGLSRIALSAHWPSDVAGGWLLGSAWVLACTAGLVRLGSWHGPASDDLPGTEPSEGQEARGDRRPERRNPVEEDGGERDR